MNLAYQDFEKCKYKDINGFPVKRTPWTDPYSYDTFCICKTTDFSRDDNAFYSDRFFGWYDSDKVKEAQAKFKFERGDYFWAYYPPEVLSKFLSYIMDSDIKVTAVQQTCNVATGYPLWIISYKDLNSKETS